jgi:hypothetical protein
MKDVMSRFLDAVASRCAYELRMAGEFGDNGKHADASEHLTRYDAMQDVLTLGQEMLGRELDCELKKIREGAKA